VPTRGNVSCARGRVRLGDVRLVPVPVRVEFRQRPSILLDDNPIVNVSTKPTRYKPQLDDERVRPPIITRAEYLRHYGRKRREAGRCVSCGRCRGCGRLRPRICRCRILPLYRHRCARCQARERERHQARYGSNWSTIAQPTPQQSRQRRRLRAFLQQHAPDCLGSLRRLVEPSARPNKH
jgi:hypothetical protein